MGGDGVRRQRETARATVPHPRNYGTFSRKIGYYALQEQTLSLAQAIRSASGLPADILGLKDRGYLRPGMMADVVVFEPASFRDQATFVDPHQYSAGLSLVLINGQPALQHGTPTGALVGQVLRHSSSLALRPDQQMAVDALFEPWDRSDSPGCTLGIVRRGHLIYGRGYGVANLDEGSPLTTDSVFYLASVSKQFVAAAIAILVLDQKLDSSDDVRAYIPELPDYDAKITVDHLLHHTSGLPDYLELMERQGMSFGNEYSREELLKMICRQRKLDFTPGERYAYSNSGYFLLAEIVQRVSGQSCASTHDSVCFFPEACSTHGFMMTTVSSCRDAYSAIDRQTTGRNSVILAIGIR